MKIDIGVLQKRKISYFCFVNTLNEFSRHFSNISRITINVGKHVGIELEATLKSMSKFDTE